MDDSGTIKDLHTLDIYEYRRCSVVSQHACTWIYINVMLRSH